MLRVKRSLEKNPGITAIMVMGIIIVIAIIFGQSIKSPDSLNPVSEPLPLITQEQETDDEKGKKDIKKVINQKTGKEEELNQLKKNLDETKKKFDNSMKSLNAEIKKQKQQNDALKEEISEVRKIKENQKVEDKTQIDVIVDGTVSRNEKKTDENQIKVKEDKVGWVKYFGTSFPNSNDDKKKGEKVKITSDRESSEKTKTIDTDEKSDGGQNIGNTQRGVASDIKQVKNVNPSQKAYSKAFRGLMSLGKITPEKKNVQLAIINDPGKGLKEVYGLFGMTPFIRLNKKYYSLSTGQSLSPIRLDSFAGTGILCENPWRDFGAELSAVQEKTGMSLSKANVIYLMESNTMNYFYHKVDKAINCSLNLGKVSTQKIQQSQVSVTGRVLAVSAPNKQHQFGIFVPILIEIFDKSSENHRRIEVDPKTCFKDDPDIAPLVSEGLF
jgi:hypothetical protein